MLSKAARQRGGAGGGAPHQGVGQHADDVIAASAYAFKLATTATQAGLWREHGCQIPCTNTHGIMQAMRHVYLHADAAPKGRGVHKALVSAEHRARSRAVSICPGAECDRMCQAQAASV